ncbi:GDP-mannose mannosyl hydrolase [Shewanella sp. 202IG2-18]|uniref:GDP-mannose mannosyl hydrolase n=1 Tax=Parashewanella hymeniacidonis TaxID=2807618 RepID=UPI00195FA7D4|nr:GDP-mannose mannosyl hydrolase [Parashewanella hymeniacidonis]MBM7072037.1 GDP-mannose mannosyl hydrolase [Parashewanella hymeniacidonis]
MLDINTFKTIVKNTPLISIDLIIKNKKGDVLLGLRTNRPAKDYWFVPGGRILKDESLVAAFSRLAKNELGKSISIADANFLGVYQHFYSDNFSEDDFSTHYVVLGYELTLDIDLSDLPEQQHSDYQFLSVSSLLDSDDVHQHTKDYFL